MNVAVRLSASKEQLGIARFVLPQPYLLFLGDVVEPGFAKTAFGLRDWAGERCVGEYSLPGARVSTGLPNLDPKAAAARGARSMVIGVANPGGQIPASWFGALLDALESGLDLISGMHVRLANLPGLQAAADSLNRRLIDVRSPPAGIPIGTGHRRSGRRLLTVGTDCALGRSTPRSRSRASSRRAESMRHFAPPVRLES